MYSHLNIIANVLNTTGLIKVSDMDVLRKIISVLPMDKYASIVTILHNMGDLSTMTPSHIIGKIVTFDMSCKMGQEDATSSIKQSIALSTCDEHKKMKKKDKQVE